MSVPVPKGTMAQGGLEHCESWPTLSRHCNTHLKYLQFLPIFIFCRIFNILLISECEQPILTEYSVGKIISNIQ